MHAVKLSSTRSSIPVFKCVNTLDFKTGVAALASLNQNRFAVGGGARDGSKMAIWDTSGKPVDPPFEEFTISRLQPLNQGASVIAAGMQAANGPLEGYFSIWELNPLKPNKGYIQLLNKAVSALAVHPNKPWIATGDRGGQIKLWDLNSGYLFGDIDVAEEGYVQSLAFLNDGSILASGHNTNINIWDTKTGNKLSTIPYHKRPVLALTEMGKGILASGSDDCTVKIWNISEPTHPFLIKTLPKVYKSAAAAFALAPWSEKILISGWADHTFTVWNIENDDYWESPKEHTGSIKAITICNERLITGSDDHTVKIWEKQ